MHPVGIYPEALDRVGPSFPILRGSQISTKTNNAATLILPICWCVKRISGVLKEKPHRAELPLILVYAAGRWGALGGMGTKDPPSPLEFCKYGAKNSV
jgi:hypothetical protein